MSAWHRVCGFSSVVTADGTDYGASVAAENCSVVYDGVEYHGASYESVLYNFFSGVVRISRVDPNTQNFLVIGRFSGTFSKSHQIGL